MGYFSLDIKKAKGTSDTTQSDHIERKRKKEKRREGKEQGVSFSPAPLNRSPLANDDTIKETRAEERFVWFG